MFSCEIWLFDSVSLITPGHPRIPQDTPGQHYLYVQYII